ncbi:MAG: YkvA family protein [Hominimerdicola sp.]
MTRIDNYSVGCCVETEMKMCYNVLNKSGFVVSRHMDLKERAKKFKTDIPAVFLALKHSKTPILAKVISAVTVGYALSPVDLIPDFIPILGYLDDVILLPALIALTIKLIPDDVWTECLEKSENMWSDGKPEKWYYAIPIVIIWAIIIWLIVKAIWF